MEYLTLGIQEKCEGENRGDGTATLPPFTSYIFAGSNSGKLEPKGSCNSGLTGNKLHCAYCAINWSTSTKATIASTIGTAASPKSNQRRSQLLVRYRLEVKNVKIWKKE